MKKKILSKVMFVGQFAATYATAAMFIIVANH
jgi:hypothetical protein